MTNATKNRKLYTNSQINDFNFPGVISLSKWCEAMEAATKLGLPWRLLREKLAPPENDCVITDVNYRKTLEMLDTDLIVCSEFMYQFDI